MSKEKQLEKTAASQSARETSLLEEIVQATRLQPSDEAYSITRKGVEVLLAQMLAPGRKAAKVSRAVVDDMIAEIDRKLGMQLDEVLHHKDFQKLESGWRSLKFLVDRTDFRENIKIEMLNVSKSDLLEDFEDAPEIPKSGLYKTIYTSEYGQFGGQPYGVLVGNYEFGPGPQDMKLLQYVASVAGMAHAPFFAAISPAFFGYNDFSGSTIGEEWGFVGMTMIVLVFGLYTWLGFRIARQARTRFLQLVAIGLTCTTAITAYLHIGVVIGLLPTTGLTLPFVSFGRSNLLLSFVLTGILVNIGSSKERVYGAAATDPA